KQISARLRARPECRRSPHRAPRASNSRDAPYHSQSRSNLLSCNATSPEACGIQCNDERKVCGLGAASQGLSCLPAVEGAKARPERQSNGSKDRHLAFANSPTPFSLKLAERNWSIRSSLIARY